MMSKTHKKPVVRHSKVEVLRGNMKMISYIVFFLAIILSLSSIRLYTKNIKYQEELKLLQKEYDKEEEYSRELDAKKEYMDTDAYVEDVAREKLGLIYENEILFKPYK